MDDKRGNKRIDELYQRLVDCRAKAALYRDKARTYELELACVKGQENEILQQRMEEQLREVSVQERVICSLREELKGHLSSCLPSFIQSEGFSTDTFATALELLDYNTERTKGSQRTIEAVTWGTDNPDFTTTEAVSADDLNSAIENSCRRGVKYRHVMAFNHRYYLDRARRRLEMKLANYDLRYYDFDAYRVPPQMHFTIFDSTEITFAFYRWPSLMPKKEVRLATTNPDIVRLFSDYYEAIWQGARSINSLESIGDDSLITHSEKLSC